MVTRSTPEASEAELRQETRTALRTRLLTEAACQHLVMHEATVYLTEGEEWACTVCDAKWLASLASGGGES